MQNITQASNNKLIDRTEIHNTAMQTNTQMISKMSSVLSGVAQVSSYELSYPSVNELITERRNTVGDFLQENFESTSEDTGEERTNLQDSVNEQFDEIESNYKEDLEE